ncbi:glutamine amidotransferase class-I [Marinobacterium lacunae]|uniref:Glutamine amidotransferase class-I n=1 Tax=Marinobacterium lacunae TaxID=1232683 RepID=A0A081FXA7_9GAMM|nr:gamma-glutamyl-gamma-aminobutyrate hydrolase family protein [Marinobacterium lacunae]KEA63162.1 glutamine amidotransferase class-I [Marinobacterium lacunae]
MKIGILATGITPDTLIGQYGSYADMFVQLMGPEAHSYSIFDVRDGEFPASADQCEGWIITGSRCGVYDNLPWMQTLKQLIVDIYEADIPLVGICFGHQIIASAFGAKVEKYQGGWGVGLHTYAIEGEHSFLDAGERAFTINAMHQDQVLELPPSARLFATSEFCRYAGLVYDNRILTLQAHPEFSIDYERELVRSRKSAVVPDEVADKGLETLTKDAKVDSALVAKWMTRFLTRGRAD